MRSTSIEIRELTRLTSDDLAGLARLLIDAVEHGASVGFLPPLRPEEAEAYWSGVLGEGAVLWAARSASGEIVGTVQLQLARRANGAHRAEIAKLMVHSEARRQGIGCMLMQTAEERARRENRTLLVLDTREGDPSNLLYRSLGYIEAGRIPQYAISADGGRDATVIYYKLTDPA